MGKDIIFRILKSRWLVLLSVLHKIYRFVLCKIFNFLSSICRFNKKMKMKINKLKIAQPNTFIESNTT